MSNASKLIELQRMITEALLLSDELKLTDASIALNTALIELDGVGLAPKTDTYSCDDSMDKQVDR